MKNKMKQGVFNLLLDILGGDNKIVIPDLQRDYCWGNSIISENGNSLTHNFTSELITQAHKSAVNEYSYGLLYVYEFPETFLFLCDGQQRITTLYLILGVLNGYSESNIIENLLKLPNNQPRLSFEIRHSTDYFLKDLLKKVFLKRDNSQLNDVTKCSWFKDDYRDDPTIKAMIAALKSINELINKENANKIILYIIRSVGFVYFNLDKEENKERLNSKIREYGEKMYEIVNTRGNPMEPNEHIKSLLLSHLEDSEKQKWTEKWEIWQDFFWQNKGENESGDKGFNEFLTWIKEIESETLEVKKSTQPFLYDLENIESYFKAFFFLINKGQDIADFKPFEIVQISDLYLVNKKIPEVVLYSCLIYLNNTNYVIYDGSNYSLITAKIDLTSIYKFIRFFSNISKNTKAIVEVIQLAKLIEKNSDVVTLLNIDREYFKNTLTEEEIFKLTLLKDCQSESIREEYETVLWKAEDHPYLNGQLWPLLKLLNGAEELIFLNSFDLNRFKSIYLVFKNHFKNEAITNTQKGLLAMTNFSVWNCFSEGSSWGQPRHYLGSENANAFWQRIVKNELFLKFMQELLSEKSIEEIIEKYIEEESHITWSKVKRKIVVDAQNHWTWNESKRFFIHDGNICYPHGVQAKNNTIKVPID